MKSSDIEKLQKLSALFQQLASDNYELDDQGRWRLKPQANDAPFDIQPEKLVDCVRRNSFMHHIATSHPFEPDERELTILDALVTRACAENGYKSFRLLGCGQDGLVIEGMTDDGRQDALRFGYRVSKDWRLNFPLMVDSSYGVFMNDNGYLLEAMPSVLMLAQCSEEVRMLVEDAFEPLSYARDAIKALLLGTPIMLKLFHDLALWPDGTLVNVDPENAVLTSIAPMTPQQLRCKLLVNASNMVYCPTFLELYTPDGRTKQELFFPTKNPRTPTPR